MARRRFSIGTTSALAATVVAPASTKIAGLASGAWWVNNDPIVDGKWNVVVDGWNFHICVTYILDQPQMWMSKLWN